MVRLRSSPAHPAAILSFHSHSDRSFLDDRELALLSGSAARGRTSPTTSSRRHPTRHAGGARRERRRNAAGRGAVRRTIRSSTSASGARRLSSACARSCRARCSSACAASTCCSIRLRPTCSATATRSRCSARCVHWLRGERADPPAPRPVPSRSRPARPRAVAAAGGCGSHRRRAPFATRRICGRWSSIPEALPPSRTFSIVGNDGCPFQLDARANPLYAGTEHTGALRARLRLLHDRQPLRGTSQRRDRRVGARADPLRARARAGATNCSSSRIRTRSAI